MRAIRLALASIRAELRWYSQATWRGRWDRFWHGLRDTDPGNWSGGPPL